MRIGVLLLLMSLVCPTATAKMPSPEMRERLRRHQEAMGRKRAAAKPWRDALARAIRIRRGKAEIVAQTFAATYKHHDPREHATRAALDRRAGGFAAAWRTLDRLCRRHHLDPVALAAAIYQMTNSDYMPVPCGSGAGHDKVKTGKDYLRWGKALIRIGAKHNKDGMAKKIWVMMAESMSFGDIKDVEAKKLKSIQPPPRCW